MTSGPPSAGRLRRVSVDGLPGVVFYDVILTLVFVESGVIRRFPATR